MTARPENIPISPAPSLSRRRRTAVCFVATSPAMLNHLTGEGPEAMGGAELQLAIIASALRQRGWDTSFLVGDYGQPHEIILADGTRVLKAYPAVRGRPSPITMWQVNRALGESLAAADADIYLTRGLTWLAGAIVRWTRRAGRRYVFWFGKNDDARYAVPWRSSLPLHERLPAWYGMTRADAVVVQSQDQMRLLREQVGREGIHIPNVMPWEEMEEAGRAGEYALWIGSIQPKKRPHMMLDVAEACPDLAFVMAGGAMKRHEELYNSVVNRATALPNVDFRGFVPFNHTRELFERAGVLVSTSLGHGEGFPNVFLQAWSTNTPVVATCDPDHLIANHALGQFCETTEEIAEAVGRFLGNPQLQLEVGARARTYVTAHHSVDAVMARLEPALRELVPSTLRGMSR